MFHAFHDADDKEQNILFLSFFINLAHNNPI